MHKLIAILIGLPALALVLATGSYHQPPQPLPSRTEFCAVTLNVTGPKGEPIASTWIELVDPAGHVVRREMMHGSEHKICDFGFGPHTLRVGTNECLPVAISNLRVVFGQPLMLNVVLNDCGYRGRIRTGCLIYLRALQEDKAPIADVSLSPNLDPNGSHQTDAFGRYQSLFRGAYDLSLAKSGFETTTTHIQCQRDEEVDVEVVMKRAGKRQP